MLDNDHKNLQFPTADCNPKTESKCDLHVIAITMLVSGKCNCKGMVLPAQVLKELKMEIHKKWVQESGFQEIGANFGIIFGRVMYSKLPILKITEKDGFHFSTLHLLQIVHFLVEHVLGVKDLEVEGGDEHLLLSISKHAPRVVLIIYPPKNPLQQKKNLDLKFSNKLNYNRRKIFDIRSSFL